MKFPTDLILIWPLLSAVVAFSEQMELETMFRWNKLEFVEEPNTKHEYISENNALGNIRVHQDRVFISVPRWRDGVPSTLNVIKLDDKKRHSGKLTPYPSLSSNTVGDCTALQNVASLELDPLGRLWVADSGTAAIFSKPNRKCPAKLVVYSPNNRQEFVHVFPRKVVTDNSVLMHMSLHFTEDEETFAYLADINQGTIVVVSVKENKSFVKQSDNMSPVSTAVNVDGERIQLRFGVTSLALESQAEEPRVFFSTLSRKLLSVPAWVLQNETLGQDISDYVETIGQRRSSCEASTFDDLGNLYYGLLEEGSVVKWNASAEPLHLNVDTLVRDKQRLSWINSLTIQDNYLWIASNRFHLFTWSSMDFDQLNFGIFRVPIEAGNYMNYYVSSSPIQQHFPRLVIVIINVILFVLVTKISPIS